MTLSTAPTSKRFPTTNQAKACYMYYNSWHQCKYDYSDEEPQCAKLKSWAMAMCPFEWVRRPARTMHGTTELLNPAHLLEKRHRGLSGHKTMPLARCPRGCSTP